MNFQGKIFFGALTLLVSTSISFAAQTINFSSCSGSDSYRTQCVLEKPVELAKLPEEMTASYKINYRFSCKGHKTGLAFDAGSEKKALEYTTNEVQLRTIMVDGPNSLQFTDLDPAATYRATLVGVCALTVDSVSITPSVSTTIQWSKDAETQAKIIRLSLDRYELISDYKAYTSWDSKQTQTILDSAKLKVLLFETQCNGGDKTACRSLAHFRVLVGALQAKIDGTPATPISNEDGDEIVTAYKKDLEAEVSIGLEMIDRFKRWSLAVSAELQKILDSVQQQTSGES